MEYVIVTFPKDRFVYFDDEQNGRANEVLRVDGGAHVFNLGPYANYRPESRKVTVKDTTPLEPREITFCRKDNECGARSRRWPMACWRRYATRASASVLGSGAWRQLSSCRAKPWTGCARRGGGSPRICSSGNRSKT